MLFKDTVSTGLGRPRKKKKGKPKTTAEIIEKDFSDSEEDSRANFNNNSAREENSIDSFFDHKKKKKKDSGKGDRDHEDEDTTRDSLDIRKKKKKVREANNTTHKVCKYILYVYSHVIYLVYKDL